MVQRASRKHSDYGLETMEHYSGYVAPSKWFVDNDILGKVVPNDWIVGKMKPWYLTEWLPKNRKLSSEASQFKTRKLLNNTLEVLGSSRLNSCEIITQRDQRNLKIICSMMNVCQLAYSNVSINTLKELLVRIWWRLFKKSASINQSWSKRGRQNRSGDANQFKWRFTKDIRQLRVPAVDFATSKALKF